MIKLSNMKDIKDKWKKKMWVETIKQNDIIICKMEDIKTKAKQES